VWVRILKKLRAAGWKVGDAGDFLRPSNEAATAVELKLSLARAVIEEWRRQLTLHAWQPK